MASNFLEVANLALEMLGEDPIESETQNSPGAKAIARVKNLARKAELRRYTWNFSVRRASLAAETSQTTWGELNKFVLPTGFVRLILDDETDDLLDWRIESDDKEATYIVTTDEAPLNIKYVHDVTTPALWDALFDIAYACSMARFMAIKTTGSAQRLAQVMTAYEEAINEAMRVGSLEKIPDDPPEGTYLQARR